MSEQANPVLKVGCILMIVGGLVCSGTSVVGILASLGSMTQMDGSMYSYVESQMRDLSDGLYGVEAAVGMVTGMVAVLVAIYVAMLVIDLAVGFVGLGRLRQPAKYRFFLVWGIVLLVIGALGTLLSGILTVQGLSSLVCGVAAPILFIVGASQQKRAFLASQQARW